MTAINVIVQPRARAGFILSDTAITSSDGRVIEHCGKIIYGVGSYPWAVGVSGSVHPAVILQEIGALNPLSYKQLVKGLPDALRRAVAKQACLQGCPEADLAITIAGVAWHFGEKRPVGFAVTSRLGHVYENVAPFEFYGLASSVTGVENDSVRNLITCRDLTDPMAFNPENDGVELMKLQRAMPLQAQDARAQQGHYRIGGEVLLTTVTKRGVATKALHDFGDQIGAIINPNAVDA